MANDSLQYWNNRLSNAKDEVEKQHCREYIAHYEADAAFIAALERKYSARLTVAEVLISPLYIFMLAWQAVLLSALWIIPAFLLFGLILGLAGFK